MTLWRLICNPIAVIRYHLPYRTSELHGIFLARVFKRFWLEWFSADFTIMIERLQPKNTYISINVQRV